MDARRDAFMMLVGAVIFWFASYVGQMDARSTVAHSGGLSWAGVEYRCEVR
jgi:hypothetical protein